jgi:hypothetical protein
MVLCVYYKHLIQIQAELLFNISICVISLPRSRLISESSWRGIYSNWLQFWTLVTISQTIAYFKSIGENDNMSILLLQGFLGTCKLRFSFDRSYVFWTSKVVFNGRLWDYWNQYQQNEQNQILQMHQNGSIYFTQRFLSLHAARLKATH